MKRTLLVGHFFIFTRAGHTRLFQFDETGQFTKEIGKDLYAWDFAHTVRVDKEDDIWATDEGSNMVVKFNPQAPENELHVGEIQNWRMQRLMLKSAARSSIGG